MHANVCVVSLCSVCLCVNKINGNSGMCSVNNIIEQRNLLTWLTHPVVISLMRVNSIFLFLVLSVTKATSDSLTFNWKGSEMATENTIYELQLRLVSSERDFTQVRSNSHQLRTQQKQVIVVYNYLCVNLLSWCVM